VTTWQTSRAAIHHRCKEQHEDWVGHRNQFIVKVETDEGIHGWGEGGMSWRELAAVKHYREWLIGRDPMRRGALWQEM